MLSSLMIARSRLAVLALLVAVSGIAAACERVPLLAPTGSTISLTTAESSVAMNGSINIVAQLLEPAGTPPHSGTHVSFTTTLGSVQPSETETDINGRAVVSFKAGTVSGFATIVASSGAATTGTNGALVIAVGAAAVGRLTLVANPTRVSASGGTSTITATVQDAVGNVLGNIPVTFTTDAGSLSALVATSDQNGNATTTLTTNATAKVTATGGVAITSGTTTTATPITQTVTVSVNAASTVTIGEPSPAGASVGQSVTLPITYAQNPNGSPLARLVVDFGDGSGVQTFQGSPSSVSHVYDSSGVFTVRATAFDTFGDSTTGSKSVTILPRPQIAVAVTVPASPTAGVAATFGIAATATTGGAITSITVDFGDGSSTTLSGNASSVSHAYLNPGTYTVTASASDSNGNRGSGSAIIVVGVTFTVSPSAAKVGQTVSASVDSPPQPGTSYGWEWGDGATTSGSSSTHAYAVASTYVIRLTVTSSAGTATKTQTIVISP